ncbi:hypothetical protein QJS10_CPB12g01266 [Acorus calamus]|uniref:RNase H type-1 domain-containing protein n=1 Tax=Acorus calamus TaxID=4465 RepID=A0AAV9DNK8_ACOCL|nr:hypothetical protein QJS10_CPB12g01266 [Acorus calamus]
MVTWFPPDVDWLKLNTDGSLADDRGGYGAVIRNDRAEFLIGLAGRLDLPSINLLELKAIEKGIWLGIQLGASHLWVESDSTTALAWIHGKGNAPWSSFRSLRSIHHGLQQLQGWKASHIYREGNSPADLAASFQLTRGETTFYLENLWNEIREAMDQDRKMEGYLRKS